LYEREQDDTDDDDDALGDALAPPAPTKAEHARARRAALWQLTLALAVFFGARVALDLLGIFSWIERHAPAWEIPAHVFAQGAIALGVVALALRAAKAPWASIGLARPSRPWTEVGRGFMTLGAVYTLMVPIMIAVALLIRGPGQAQMVQRKTEVLREFVKIPLVALLPSAVMAGVYEEIFVRGLLHARLATVFSGAARPSIGSRAAAVVIGSVLFGLGHAYQGAMGVMQTMLVGLILGVASAYWRTLWPAVVAHVAIDTIGLIASRVLVPVAQRMAERM
jgi:membrane protease YdiL (CAAX protease family)